MVGERIKEFRETGKVELSAGYTITKKDDLLVPVAFENEEGFRELMTRESAYSFPAAAAGTVVAGPAGTVAGHVTGTTLGFIRHRQLNPEEDIFDPERPPFLE